MKLTPEDMKVIATLEGNAGFDRLMQWSEDAEKEQTEALLRIDVFRDPDQATKLQACLLEKRNYRNLLKQCIAQSKVKIKVVSEIDEAEKKTLLQKLKARI